MKKFMLLLGCAPLAIQAAEPTKPNIVIFVADDCRYEDLGCYGSVDAVTPHIDKIASEGVRFDAFYQATAMSSPTRQCLMTGLYPIRSGAYPNHAVAYEGTKSIVHYLGDCGYHVALLGKQHVNPPSVYPYEYLGGWKTLSSGISKYLKERKEDKEPFCMFVCSNDPHMPWTRGNRSLFNAEKISLPEFVADTPETRKGYVNYLAEINQLDSDVGIVDRLIDKYGFKENTLFIFTSEHGFTLPFAKWTCYGQGLHTGFIARWPGKVQPGTSNKALCEYVDVVPTLVDAAGGIIPKHLDGKSFLSVLKGDKTTHKEEVYGIQTSRGIVYGGEHYAVRSVFDGRYRYILNLSHDEPFQCVQMQDPDSIWVSWCKKASKDKFTEQQVMRYVYRPEVELYDTQYDPYEMKNLADQKAYRKIQHRLKNKLEHWMKSQGDKGLETEMKALEHMNAHGVGRYFETKNKVELPCKK